MKLNLDRARGTGDSPVSFLNKKHGRAAHATALLCCILVFSISAAKSSSSTSSARFRSIDIFIDSRGAKLAAYQIEFAGESDQVKPVGIEGGEHPAFKEPPYYDPKALP